MTRRRPGVGGQVAMGLKVGGLVASEHLSPWAVVLAAGAGRRLAEVTGGVPKQFWGVESGASLLETTLDRIGPLAAPKRRTLVIDRGHMPLLGQLSGRPRALHVLRQPSDRGTAAGVLLGLLPVLDSGPDAIVLITPSDHGVLDTAGFRASVRDAVARVAADAERLVLFGSAPDAADDEYGWIVCDHQAPVSPAHPLRRVAGFVEKPSSDVARGLRAAGAVWSTMVLVARSSSLLDLYRRHLPDLTARFERVLRLPRAARAGALEDAYEHLPRADFSRDLLTQAGGLSVRIWPKTLGWTDLGTPGRLREFLRRSDHALAALQARPAIRSA